jgi:hypothetical protein
MGSTGRCAGWLRRPMRSVRAASWRCGSRTALGRPLEPLVKSRSAAPCADAGAPPFAPATRLPYRDSPRRPEKGRGRMPGGPRSSRPASGSGSRPGAAAASQTLSAPPTRSKPWRLLCRCGAGAAPGQQSARGRPGQRPAGAAAPPPAAPGVRSHCRTRERGTEYYSEHRTVYERSYKAAMRPSPRPAEVEERADPCERRLGQRPARRELGGGEVGEGDGEGVREREGARELGLRTARGHAVTLHCGAGDP